ncbi:hypothetical protein L2E82_39825 [Cichorium intybus]|uniref:Uncharacterized protein n=1 Tax=Cichorium intybus TaxID=13427 RepID=A0ACB9AJK5_CICIN|nr:hypothetical protein L2E82_39825 [Cichorium intybus]
MIPNSIWDVITELCTFFRAICSRVLHMDDLIQLQQSIVETICKLEKLFPPDFCDSMEHLVIHLTREAILGGPVQYRWMYLHERLLGSLKRKIKDQPTIDIRLNREYLSFAPEIPSSSRTDSRLSIFKVSSQRLFEKSGRRRLLSDDELRIAHRYILFNCEEIDPFVRLFDDIMRKEPTIDTKGIAKYRYQHFAEWFKQHVSEESNNVNQQLKNLAQGPLRHVWSHKGYFVNGYKFHTEKYGDGQVTHNNGVCVRGSTYNEHALDYYGLLNEVLEVEYHGVDCYVVFFNCTWFDTAKNGGVTVDTKHNLVDIKYNSRILKDEPFVLASQTEQVYYTLYPSMAKDLEDWWAVVKMKPRSIYEVGECVGVDEEVDNDDIDDEGRFFQESEMLKVTTISPQNEVEEPICPVIEGEFEEVYDNGDEGIEVSEKFEEFDNNSDDDDDEVNICDHPSYGPKAMNQTSYDHESSDSSLTPSKRKRKSTDPLTLGSSEFKEYLEHIRGVMREEIRQEMHQEIPKVLAGYGIKIPQNPQKNLKK